MLLFYFIHVIIAFILPYVNQLEKKQGRPNMYFVIKKTVFLWSDDFFLQLFHWNLFRLLASKIQVKRSVCWCVVPTNLLWTKLRDLFMTPCALLDVLSRKGTYHFLSFCGYLSGDLRSDIQLETHVFFVNWFSVANIYRLSKCFVSTRLSSKLISYI